MKKVFAALIILVVLLGGYRLFQERFAGSSGAGRGRRVAVTAVEVKQVRQATISDEGYFTGTLAPRSAFKVAPKLSGKVKKVFADIGDPVERGQGAGGRSTRGPGRGRTDGANGYRGG